MSLDFFQISKLFLSFIMALFMALEYQRDKNREFLFFGAIFGFFFLKELVYIWINLYGSYYVTVKDETTGFITKTLANEGLFNLRFFIWHVFELIFVVLLVYSYLLMVGSIKKGGNIANFVTLGLNALAIIGVFVAVLIVFGKLLYCLMVYI
jgi:hypothetical protein